MLLPETTVLPEYRSNSSNRVKNYSGKNRREREREREKNRVSVVWREEERERENPDVTPGYAKGGAYMYAFDSYRRIGGESTRFVRALAVTPSRATPGELLRERERKKGTRG